MLQTGPFQLFSDHPPTPPGGLNPQRQKKTIFFLYFPPFSRIFWRLRRALEWSRDFFWLPRDSVRNLFVTLQRSRQLKHDLGRLNCSTLLLLCSKHVTQLLTSGIRSPHRVSTDEKHNREIGGLLNQQNLLCSNKSCQVEALKKKKHKPTATLVDADSSQASKTSDAAHSGSRSRSKSPEKEWKPETPERSLSVEY